MDGEWRKQREMEGRKVNAARLRKATGDPQQAGYYSMEVPGWVLSVDIKSANGKKALSVLPACLPSLSCCRSWPSRELALSSCRFNLMFGCTILAAVERSGGGTVGHLLPGCSFQRLRSASAHLQSGTVTTTHQQQRVA
jgi:hypothetical protein